jgi:hypothetical protein
VAGAGFRLLVLGMVTAVAGSSVVAVAPEQTTVRTAMILVALLLMAAGYLGIANQVSGWPRCILRLVAAVHLAWLGWVIARPFLELDDGHYLVAAIVWWSGIWLLAIAARAWSSLGIAIAAVLAVTLEAVPWAPYLAPAFDAFVADLPGLEPWIRPLRELLTSAALLVLVRAIR